MEPVTNSIALGLDPNEIIKHFQIIMQGLALIIQGMGMVLQSGLVLVGMAKVITRLVGTVHSDQLVAIMKFIGKIALDANKVDHNAVREQTKTQNGGAPSANNSTPSS